MAGTVGGEGGVVPLLCEARLPAQSLETTPSGMSGRHRALAWVDAISASWPGMAFLSTPREPEGYRDSPAAPFLGAHPCQKRNY